MNEIPHRTVLLVRSNKLIKTIKNFCIDNMSLLKKEDRVLFSKKLKRDGCFILTKLMGYNRFEEHKFEFFLTFVWSFEFYNELNLNILEIIDNWERVGEKTQNLLIENVVNSSHSINFFESLHFITTLSLGLEHKRILSNNLELLFNDYYTCIINIDNTLLAYEKQKFIELNQILKLDYNSIDININKDLEVSNSLTSTLSELENLVGLNQIKREVNSLINFVKINQLRKTKGLPLVSMSMHSVFYGPPGTGKTTIARTLAKAFKNLGLLKKGHLVETDRSQLVAGYVGQTAIKTKKILDQALDGVLFIDEAYSLNSKDDYGSEAVDIILKYMEDNRERLVVIVAGYEHEMKNFIESNPGLKSRFNKYFYFPKFSGSELLEILEKLIEKNKFRLTVDAKVELLNILNNAVFTADKHFGNARYVRNLYQQIIQNQFVRISQLNNIEDKDLSEITIKDITSVSTL